MKKLLLLSITAGMSFGAFAQRASVGHTVKTSPEYNTIKNNVAAKTTAVGDTFILSNFNSADTLAIYTVPNDSGYCAGTDGYGDKGFAERYDFSGADSTVKVIGVMSFFGGNISATSTKTVTFNVWSQGAKTVVTGRPNLYNSGFPNTVLTSQVVPITQLGIGISVGDTARDTVKARLFTTPTAYLNSSFFVGYTINYTWSALAGDTLGVYSNKDGERSAAGYTVSGPDTTINNKNATQYSDNTWHDNNVSNFGLFYNLYLRPIVIIGAHPVGVASVTKNDFTFYGNFPNPAVNSTNIKFALAKNANVSIQIMDMSGRTVKTITTGNLSAGEQSVSLETGAMAAGDYIYVINTSNGDGIASKLTVIK